MSFSAMETEYLIKFVTPAFLHLIPSGVPSVPYETATILAIDFYWIV